MSRSIVVHGEALISVKGPAGSAIASLTELGLADNQAIINVTPMFNEVKINAWGDGTPDVQRKLAFVEASFSLIQYDPAVLEECARLAMGGTAFGKLGRAGALMGNGLPRFHPNNNYVGFNLAAPQSGRPWRFLYAYMRSPIGGFAHGTDPGIVAVTFRGVPYTADPWNGGAGATDYVLFDRNLDT